MEKVDWAVAIDFVKGFVKIGAILAIFRLFSTGNVLFETQAMLCLEHTGPDVRTPGRPDVRTSGRPDAWMPGRPDVQTSGRPDVRLVFYRDRLLTVPRGS